MKYLLLLLLLPFGTSAQIHRGNNGLFTMKTIAIDTVTGRFLYMGAKDFDYTLFTTKAFGSLDNPDSLFELTVFRRIEKVADVLKIINLTNTGDCITYHLHYIGASTDSNSLIYTNDAQETITISPMIPLVVIGRTRYY